MARSAFRYLIPGSVWFCVGNGPWLLPSVNDGGSLVKTKMIDTKSRAIVWGVGLYIGVWLVVLLLAVPIGWALYGPGGMRSAIVGSAIGGVAGLVSLLVMAIAVLLKQATAGVLGGMLVRMGIALAGIFVLPDALPELVNQGLIPIFLGVYFAVLISETLISLSWVNLGSVEKG